MRQPVVTVIHAVNAAFQYFVAATELLRVLQHVLRFDQTQFPLTVPHEWDPNQPQIGCCRWAVKLCKFLQVFAVQKWGPRQLVCFQAVTLDTTNQLCCIIKKFGNDCCEGARKLVDERTKE
jgi:hypothetical protein